jgi:hypothetical protein
MAKGFTQSLFGQQRVQAAWWLDSGSVSAEHGIQHQPQANFVLSTNLTYMSAIAGHDL